MTKLMQFEYEIRYRKGSDNTAGDALSRVPAPVFYALASFVVPLELVGWIKAFWAEDPYVQKIITEKEEDPTSHVKFSWVNGELRRKGKLVVGSDLVLRAQILNLFHASALGGHLGALVTYKRASAVVYWPKLSKEVREFVRGGSLTLDGISPRNGWPIRGEKPHTWAQWLRLVEYWYNTSFHSTIKLTPFEALYGYEPLLHVPYLPGDSNIEAVDIALRDREEKIALLKANLERPAVRMQNQANKNIVDREYAIGELILLKLQKYRQKSIWGKHHKFGSKYFGPYQIVDQIGQVAYRLNLPATTAIHNVFHVSLL
ncbi:uncharacterized protein LOC121810688 [Salvia splendens]|uniref:uncharacterized protein LOC121810688 n=1 Tax=Salvia splendens TaxID=180675 RepID=UPI001C255F7F|nr:uncharacterized protein LOC121810688 [Salvia splendens]